MNTVLHKMSRLLATSTTKNWESAGLPTLSSQQAFCARIRFILSRLKEESWLPQPLQDRIVDCCAAILSEQWRGNLTVDQARTRVEELAAISYDYDHLTLESRTLCQIRTLDLELNDLRPLPKITEFNAAFAV